MKKAGVTPAFFVAWQGGVSRTKWISRIGNEQNAVIPGPHSGTRDP